MSSEILHSKFIVRSGVARGSLDPRVGPSQDAGWTPGGKIAVCEFARFLATQIPAMVVEAAVRPAFTHLTAAPRRASDTPGLASTGSCTRDPKPPLAANLAYPPEERFRWNRPVALRLGNGG